ncbi:MAG: hypothetical protein ACYDBQ_09600 [Thermoplasmatota archaeon]
MATTVRVRDEDKRDLDALQARLVLAEGRRLPLDELMHRVVRVAGAHEGELTESAPAPSREKVKAFMAGTGNSGHPANEEDIDAHLYGEE